MGYTILRHLTSPGAVNTREIRSIVLFAKKWRAGNPSIFIFYYIILSSCSSFQEGLPNLSLFKWLLVSHNSWSLLMLLGVQH
jgi:hypothetical protein